MPTPREILAGLEEIANVWTWLAIVWRVYLAAIVVALAAGARPANRVLGTVLALPVLSVSALAWRVGNPFNGAFFALVGVLMIVTAILAPRAPVGIARPSMRAPGIVLFAFGWIYPHFLEGAPFWKYLYAAPTGLIPCPTLSAVAGLGLIGGGLGSRAWSLVVGIAGLFYGLFGAMRLGVPLDWALAAGAILTIWMSGRMRR